MGPDLYLWAVKVLDHDGVNRDRVNPRLGDSYVLHIVAEDIPDVLHKCTRLAQPYVVVSVSLVELVNRL